MTDEEAIRLAADLEDFARLWTNGAWQHHLLPEIARMRDEARARIRDESLSDATRVHHVQAWENAQALLEFCERAEQRITAQLREYHQAQGFKRVRFLDPQKSVALGKDARRASQP